MIEDYAEYLSAEARSDVSALHQFRILYDRSRDEVHFFFEGEDDSLFYMPEARRHLGGRTSNIYDCGGKGNVVRVREEIKSDEYDIGRCLFFVDRDYDDILNTQIDCDEYTYMTDNYSIENDIATVEAACVLLEDVVRLSKADPEFARLEARLVGSFDLFRTRIRPLVAWIVAAKETGCSPNLNNTNGLRGVMVLADMEPLLTSGGFITFKKRVVTQGRVPTIESILKWRRRLDIESSKLWIRGKYALWFFQVILLAGLEEANSRRKAAGGKVLRVPSSLRDGRIFEVLGGRIAPPSSLDDFFRSRLS